MKRVTARDVFGIKNVLQQVAGFLLATVWDSRRELQPLIGRDGVSKESGKPQCSEGLRYKQFWLQEGGRSPTFQPDMEMKAEMQLTRLCGACTRELKLLKFLLTLTELS